MTGLKKRKKVDFSSLKFFMMPLLVLSLILISFFHFLRPKIEEISQMAGTIKKKEDKLTKLTEKLSMLKGLNEPELARRSKLVLQSLPETKKPILIIGVLKQLLNESGLEIKKISVDPGEIATESGKKKEEEVPFLSFSLRFSGTFDQASDFLKKLDKTLPLLRLGKISFKRSGSGERLAISTTVLSYYSYFPETLGKIDAPVQVITEEERKIADRLKQFSLPFVSEESFFPQIESGRINPFI